MPATCVADIVWKVRLPSEFSVGGHSKRKDEVLLGQGFETLKVGNPQTLDPNPLIEKTLEGSSACRLLNVLAEVHETNRHLSLNDLSVRVPD